MSIDIPTYSPELARQEQAKLLASLGQDFEVCFDALQESPDFTSKLPQQFVSQEKKNDKIFDRFNDEKFFETLKMLAKDKPVYLEYTKKLFKEGMEPPKEQEASTKEEEEEMAEFYEKNPKLKPDLKQQANLKSPKEMADLAAAFITRIEFFSRLEHLPERITTGGKTVEQLETELARANITTDIQQILRNKKFKTSKTPEKIDLVRLKPKDLFPDNQNHTTDEIYKKAKDLGLEFCPSEVGPAYRLAYRLEGELKKEQPINEWISIAMEPISDSDRDPRVFDLDSNEEDGIFLFDNFARPAEKWSSNRGIVFCLRK